MTIKRVNLSNLDQLTPLFGGYMDFYGQIKDPAKHRICINSNLTYITINNVKRIDYLCFNLIFGNLTIEQKCRKIQSSSLCGSPMFACIMLIIKRIHIHK